MRCEPSATDPYQLEFTESAFGFDTDLVTVMYWNMHPWNESELCNTAVLCLKVYFEIYFQYYVNTKAMKEPLNDQLNDSLLTWVQFDLGIFTALQMTFRHSGRSTN